MKLEAFRGIQCDSFHVYGKAASLACQEAASVEAVLESVGENQI